MKRTVAQRVVRKLKWMCIACGGCVYGSSCLGGPEVQTAILGGIQELIVALVDALFLSLTLDDRTPVTVQLITDTLSSGLC
jgi:hypothetical protein